MGLSLAALALVTSPVELVDAQESPRSGSIRFRLKPRLLPAVLVLANEPLGEPKRLDPLPGWVLELPAGDRGRKELDVAEIGLLGEHGEQLIFHLLDRPSPRSPARRRSRRLSRSRPARPGRACTASMAQHAVRTLLTPLDPCLPQLAAHGSSIAIWLSFSLATYTSVVPSTSRISTGSPRRPAHGSCNWPDPRPGACGATAFSTIAPLRIAGRIAHHRDIVLHDLPPQIEQLVDPLAQGGLHFVDRIVVGASGRGTRPDSPARPR